MKLNQKFAHLFNDILKSKNKTKKLLNMIQQFYKKKFLDKELVLCLIKALILILSYYPEEIDVVLDILKNYKKSTIVLKINIFDLLKKSDLKKQYTLDDNMINKIIFTTFTMMVLLLKNNIYIFRIWYDILHHAKKIKTNDYIFKLNMYIYYIKESTKIINTQTNGQVYLKILNFCNKTTREINQYFSLD